MGVNEDMNGISSFLLVLEVSVINTLGGKMSYRPAMLGEIIEKHIFFSFSEIQWKTAIKDYSNNLIIRSIGVILTSTEGILLLTPHMGLTK